MRADNDIDKLEAETAAKRVTGVVGVANDIEVLCRILTSDPIPISRVTLLPRSEA